MRIFKCRFVFGFGVVLMLAVGYQPALGQDCNGNGIPDSLDLLPTPFGLPDTPDLVTIPSGLRPTSVIATARDLNGDWISLDVNEDGLVDMAATPSGQSFITVLINNGVDSDGVWLGARDYKDEPDLPPVFGNTPNEPYAITAGDLNLDGHTDLVVIFRSAKRLSVWLNLGFDSCGRWLGYAIREDYVVSYPGAHGAWPMSVAVADLGGAVADFPEVITANGSSHNISIFENKGNESNGEWRGLTGKLGTEPDDPPVVIPINFPAFPPDHYTHVIVAEDLDGDTKTDLALGSMDKKRCQEDFWTSSTGAIGFAH